MLQLGGTAMNTIHRHPPRDVEFHVTLSEEDRELLDTKAHRMGVSRTETISRALHLLESVQERQQSNRPDREEPTL
jgi:hypothetical protein